jgi:hypothetical protein
MYCPVCHGSNGDFAVRCQHCGTLLARGTPPTANDGTRRRSALASVLAATTLLSTLLALGLAGLITERNLWPQVLGGEATQTPTSLNPPGQVEGGDVSDAMNAPAMRPSQPTTLDVGQVGSADRWRFVVDGATFSPDDTENGWWQSVITYTLQNASGRTARLDIPTTVGTNAPAARPSPNVPNFVPLPSVPQKAATASDSLRLYLVDGAERRFGGGFGSGADNYQIISAPGDAVRLTYHFRYPETTKGPFILHCSFMPGIRAGDFDVHLDRTASEPAHLVAPTNVADLSRDAWLMIDNEWAVASDGVEFGPGRTTGERPITVHLRVTNLTATQMPALTDRDDPSGALRDFYLSDDAGDIAYTHSDNQPGVVVPPHETRNLTVQLFTQNMPSTASHLTFTAVLNWQSNLFGRFRLN